WRPVAILFVATVAVILFMNFPTVLGQVDSPYDPPFPRNTTLAINTGLLFSSFGPYVLLLIAAAVLTRRLPASLFWCAPLAVGLAFALSFAYISIWFWRFTLAGHLLFGLACGFAAERLKSARQFRVFTAVWALFLLPGAYQI